VFDGEIVCLNKRGTSQFTNLLFRRGEPRYYAFDLVFCNGEDLRYLPLADRKHRLRDLIPTNGERLLYCEHVEGMGEELFHLVCQRDLEGIVAKHKFDPYLLDGSVSWLKIRNLSYSQFVGREELFERERHKETHSRMAVSVRFGKTDAARRTLPMTPRVRCILSGRHVGARSPAAGWIFPAPTEEGHVNHDSLKKAHAKAIRLSKIQPFVIYSLRHTFATRIAPHVDAWTLCKIMGWASLSVAMKYIHPSEQRVLAAFGQQAELSMSGDKSGDILPTTVEQRVLELSANASSVVA
jgi:Phage integrase family/ATP dependent DNA ligase domain